MHSRHTCEMPVTLTSPTDMLKAEAVSALIRCCSTSWLDALTPTCKGRQFLSSACRCCRHHHANGSAVSLARRQLLSKNVKMRARTCLRVRYHSLLGSASRLVPFRQIGRAAMKDICRRAQFITFCAMSSREVPFRKTPNDTMTA